MAIGSAGRSDRGTGGDLSLCLFALRRSPRVNEAASPADNSAYWASVMVGIGLGLEVGAVVYGLFSMLLGGGGTVQVGSGSA